MIRERDIIAALIVSPELLAEAQTKLKPELFETPENRILYEAALELGEQDLNLSTIVGLLTQKGTIDDAGGVHKLIAITRGMPKITSLKSLLKRFELQCKCGVPKRVSHECVTDKYPIPARRETEPKQLKRDRQLSAWPEFLKNFKVGQSIVVNFTTVQSMKTHAGQAKVALVWQTLDYTIGGLKACRVWRTE